jgi:hypothetical protein
MSVVRGVGALANYKLLWSGNPLLGGAPPGAFW